MRMTGAQAIVETLVRNGVDTVFGLPGVQLDSLFDAFFEAQNRIRMIHTRHEQGAAYMALGYAQTTGRVGVCAVVPGPGVLNAAAALSTAVASNVPVLCVTGQIPTKQIGKRLGASHELRDQERALSGVVDWVKRADTPEAAPALLREAFQAALSGRQQPAIFEMPPDIMAQTAEVELLEPDSGYPEPVLDATALQAAARLLGAAERPVILVGAGVFGAEAELLAIAEQLEAPVIMSRTGRGAMSDRHYLAQGMLEGQALWESADAALVVGTRFFTPALAWGRAEEVKVVRVDIDPEQASKPRKAAITIVGQARTALAALVTAIGPHNRPRSSRQAELATIKDMLNKKLKDFKDQSQFMDAIRSELPDDAIIVTDVTQMAYFLQHLMPAYKPRTVITPGYQGTLGFAFPTGLGAKVGNPDRKVVVISGDGGFLFNVQELSTAVAHGINVVTIVFNDNTFGNVKQSQQNYYGGRHIAVDLHNPDFVMLAKSFGCAAYRAHNGAELKLALRDALAAERPALIEVPVGQFPSIWKLVVRPHATGKS